jgi:predicted nucleic acid-binding Zn ribbon protein
MNRQNQLHADSLEQLDFQQAVELINQRRVYNRKAKLLGDVINLVTARRGIAAEKSTAQLDKVWNEVLGAEWGNETRVGALRHGTLEVFVSHSILLQELTFQKQHLLERLNQELGQSGKTAVRELRFRIGETR